MATNRTLSPQGTSFIVSLEGMRAQMYNDNVGHCTIGIGHLIHRGNCIFPIFGNNAPPSPEQRQHFALEAPFHQPLSQAAAVSLFRKDIASVEDVVNSRVTAALDQPQFDALVSFTFNVGTIWFASSTLIKRLNAGHYQDVPDEMKRWVKSTSNGIQIVNAVLVRRRGREADLFENGRY